MRARVHDPGGPKGWRWGVLALALALVGAGLFGPPGAVSWALLLAGVVLAYPLRAFTERLPPRLGELVLEPGAVIVRETRLLDRRIVAGELAGAFAATTPRGTTVVLGLADYRRPPIVLELATAAEARAVLATLGVGRRGFGHVTWEVGGSGLDAAYLGSQLVAGAFWCGFALASWTASPGDEGLFAGVAFLGAIATSALAVGLGLVQRYGPHRWVTLHAGGVQVIRSTGTVALPFSAIVRVIPQAGALTFATSRPELATLVRCQQVRFSKHAPTAEERTFLVEHIEAALERSREPTAAHAETEAELVRAEGESARGWLARLEIAAGVLLRPGAYRQGNLDEGALWELLEDHDRDPRARAAAARLLIRVAPVAARVRVGAVLSTLRSDDDRGLFRVALEPDLDAAAEELESLERGRTGG